MTLRKLALTSFAASALTLAGCAYDTDHHGASAQIEPSHNILGLVKTSPGSYIPTDKDVFTVASDEIWARRDVSGDNITFLWGAISLSDY
jgi:hypothetical protein